MASDKKRIVVLEQALVQSIQFYNNHAQSANNGMCVDFRDVANKMALIANGGLQTAFGGGKQVVPDPDAPAEETETVKKKPVANNAKKPVRRRPVTRKR
jgi:hypothetical protein